MSVPAQWMDEWIRPGAATSQDVLRDVAWLSLMAVVLIATGVGLRDPWPADEPRFVLIARDMVLTGEWLVPTVGGDIYADKPPLFFWLVALAYQITGSLRGAFLLPSLFSALGAVYLVYDLARRLWNREAGFLAGALLLLTVQFVWQARQAQIDATLCFLTTLSLYGLLRHVLRGPAWSWYGVGWAAAGFGVITKGVGFLPLLVFIPFAALRARGWLAPVAIGSRMKWLLGPLAFLAAIGVWLVPVLLAAQADPALAAYRDEILFRQTIDRYASAWHHHKPFWYFFVNVVPLLWLPITALLPWLIPQWRQALRDRNSEIALLLSWVAIVLLFFSFSGGKRGVYILPAVPAVVLACAPFLGELLKKRSVQRAFFWIAGAITTLCALAAVYLLLRHDKRLEVLQTYDVDPLGPLSAMAAINIAVCAVARVRAGVLAYAGVLTSVLLVVSFWVNPSMDSNRSGAAFVARIEQAADPDAELGLVAFKEQYLLHMERPIVHFGHARWREAEQEAFDAAKWLSAKPGRQLVVGEFARALCFANAKQSALGRANDIDWFIVQGTAEDDCVRRGHSDRAYTYVPPTQQSSDRRLTRRD